MFTLNQAFYTFPYSAIKQVHKKLDENTAWVGDLNWQE